MWCGFDGKKGFPLIAWSRMEPPIKLGGLGIGNLLQKNIALLFKWLWRYFNEPNALWRRVVADKYGYDSTLNFSNLVIPSNGGPWSNICKLILQHPTAKSFGPKLVRKRVGDGSQTFFWHDLWLGEDALKSCFPRLFSIAINPNATISTLGFWDGVTWQWTFEWRRALRPRDEEEKRALFQLLQKVTLNLSQEDSYIWVPSKRGNFTVKSATLELGKSNTLSHHEEIKGIWKGLVPHRIQIFTWLALLGRINTRAKLVHIGIIPANESLCILCNESAETSEHLLLHCNFSWKLWSWWLAIWKVSWVFPLSLHDAFKQWKLFGHGEFFNKVWSAIFFILIWTLWKERNARIFNNSSSSLNELKELVLLRISWWIQGWSSNFPYSSTEILREPSCLKWQPQCSSISNISKPGTVPM